MKLTLFDGLATRLLGGLLLLLVLPSITYAQASIGGLVKDTSGAVLPGVTVEATSPALIEKARTVVTDGTGQYKIVDLRPGTYSVTFTLAGFNAIKRDSIELAGAFAATINVEMKVGSVTETITVTSESPIVDLQSVTQERVLGHDVVDAIPTGRYHYDVGVLIPGVVISNSNGRVTQDVGGSVGDIFQTLAIHGGRAADMRVTVDGLSTASGDGTGNSTGLVPNPNDTQEVSLNLSAVPAEQTGGGVQFNLIPRQGGNIFSGSFFAGGTNSGLQSNNVTSDLIARGLTGGTTGTTSINYNYDVNPGFGGPIVRDQLWFYGTARWNGVHNYQANAFYNLNAGNPTAWTYAADVSRRGQWDGDWRDASGRLTWQVTPRNKISVSYDDQNKCACQDLRINTAPETAFNFRFPFQRFVTLTWSSPLTNRLLLEAGVSNHGERYQHSPPPGDDLSLIQVTEQSTGLMYRGPIGSIGTPFDNVLSVVTNARASLSYVTGTHSFKVGFTDKYVSRDAVFSDNNASVSYRFNNGVPNQLTERATPWEVKENIGAELGVYAQDQWVVQRKLTLNLGLRYDYFNIGFPAQSLGSGTLVPARALTFPAQPFVDWKDVTPRLGASYDPWGDGRTAIKVTLNKYLVNQGLSGTYGDSGNPVNRLANTVTRSWNDANHNFVPDCVLTNPLLNGECGAVSDNNFGNSTLTTNYDPATISGWNHRPSDWEFSTSVQRQLLPKVSLNFGYFRRWYENFTVTANLATAPSDYSPFSITAPVDSRLPGGGGYVIAGLYNLNPNKVGQVNNYFTLASNYGNQYEHWNGFDVSVNARPGNGVLLEGGFSTGRTLTDNCDVVAKTGGNPSLLYCNQDSGFLTQVKLYGAYMIPKAQVQVSGTYQGIPGSALAANYNAPNALVVPSLGRNLSGGAANVTVNLIAPGAMYGDYLNQLDLRLSKRFTFNRVRLRANADLFNALNGNPVTQENSSFAVWRTPQVVQQARVARFSVQFDF